MAQATALDIRSDDATNFIFTGLCVAVAFHCGLFNIGGEGQAYIGGLGVAFVGLGLGDTLPWWIVFPLAIVASGIAGALWALIPAWLQARRGSHVVITTIMFNFIAASIMVYIGGANSQANEHPIARNACFWRGWAIAKPWMVVERCGSRHALRPSQSQFSRIPHCSVSGVGTDLADKAWI